jgi:DNA mismatch endonuclease, patch repair protein
MIGSSTDIYDRAKRSAVMRSVRRSNTAPEMVVRRFLHRNGFRFRLHSPTLAGRPDIVLPKYKAVVFVHGCFWHHHVGCPRATLPKSNIEFWHKKITDTQRRDEEDIDTLQRQGWQVFVVWQCQTRDEARLSRLIDEVRSGRHTSVSNILKR